MRALKNRLPVPRVNAGRVAAWFGDTKRFPQVDLLVKVITNGVPVMVDGGGDLSAALQYGNHRSIVPYEGNILCKIADDVRLGRAFVFPWETADRVPGLLVSPLGVTVSPAKIPIIHDLTLETSVPGVNADTDFSSAPTCKLGHVSRYNLSYFTLAVPVGDPHAHPAEQDGREGRLPTDPHRVGTLPHVRVRLPWFDRSRSAPPVWMEE